MRTITRLTTAAIAMLLLVLTVSSSRSHERIDMTSSVHAQELGQERRTIPTFKSPMINLYSRDLPRAVEFYSALGFVETFRTPASGEPVHIELTLDGFTLGIATIKAAQEQHHLRPAGEGRWIEIVLWTENTDAAVNALVAKGAPVLSPAHDFNDGKLRSAWIADPDGNPIQLVQRNN